MADLSEDIADALTAAKENAILGKPVTGVLVAVATAICLALAEVRDSLDDARP